MSNRPNAFAIGQANAMSSSWARLGAIVPQGTDLWDQGFAELDLRRQFYAGIVQRPGNGCENRVVPQIVDPRDQLEGLRANPGDCPSALFVELLDDSVRDIECLSGVHETRGVAHHDD